MSNRRIVYSDNKQITAIASQENEDSVWVAFAKNSDDMCIIQKNSAFDPSQNLYTLEREVENIPKMVTDEDNMYVAYDDDELIGEIVSVTNPLTVSIELDIPVGVTEIPVDMAINGNDLWFLLPGSASGTNAKLVRFDDEGVYVETIELDTSGSEITDASSMAIDANDDIWIVTNTDPSLVVRVYELSGGGWAYSVTEIL